MSLPILPPYLPNPPAPHLPILPPSYLPSSLPTYPPPPPIYPPPPHLPPPSLTCACPPVSGPVTTASAWTRSLLRGDKSFWTGRRRNDANTHQQKHTLPQGTGPAKTSTSPSRSHHPLRSCASREFCFCCEPVLVVRSHCCPLQGRGGTAGGRNRLLENIYLDESAS